jgi:hypothetical protein
MNINDDHHVHRNPWPSEWLALQKANLSAAKEAEQIMAFIEARGLAGFTPNMYCQIVNGNEERIMAVRRRFYDLREAGRARYHPEGLEIENAHGNAVKAWVPGRDPMAGKSKYQRAIEEAEELRREVQELRREIAELKAHGQKVFSFPP